MTTPWYFRVKIFEQRPDTDLVVADFTADLSRGWAQQLRLPATADASKIQAYRLEIIPMETFLNEALAQEAYTAWLRRMDRGEGEVPWNLLDPRERQAWDEAADAVRERVLE